MLARVTVLGGGRGVADVLRALRDSPVALSAVVSVAEVHRGNEAACGGSAVNDIRCSLLALCDAQAPLARACERELTIRRRGTQRLGDLLLVSLAEAFGDLGRASDWLGEQLRARGRVIPATTEAVQIVAADALHASLATGRAARSVPGQIERIAFRPARPCAAVAAVAAIESADVVVLAPDPLVRGVLASAAVPELAGALLATGALVLWVCDPGIRPDATDRSDGSDQLSALHAHGVRVDAVLYDPRGSVRFDSRHLAGEGIQALPRKLRRAADGGRDPRRLRAALDAVVSGRDGSAAGGDRFRSAAARVPASRRA